MDVTFYGIFMCLTVPLRWVATLLIRFVVLFFPCCCIYTFVLLPVGDPTIYLSGRDLNLLVVLFI